MFRGEHCQDCQPVPGLSNLLSARQWLQRLKHDPSSMQAVRDLLCRDAASGQVSGMTDDDVLDGFAVLLSQGQWHIHIEPVRISSVSSSPGVSETRTTPEPRRAVVRREPPAIVPPVEETLPGDADFAAIAQTLKSASETGTPFCEECVKAGMQRANQDAIHA